MRLREEDLGRLQILALGQKGRRGLLGYLCPEEEEGAAEKCTKFGSVSRRDEEYEDDDVGPPPPPPNALFLWLLRRLFHLGVRVRRWKLPPPR